MKRVVDRLHPTHSIFVPKILKPKFSNKAEFAQWAYENPVLSGLTLTKPPYIGGFRHFAIENLV